VTAFLQYQETEGFQKGLDTAQHELNIKSGVVQPTGLEIAEESE